MKPSGSATASCVGQVRSSEPPFDQTADVETHRARIDADDARHKSLFLRDQLPRDVRDRLGIQHQIVAREEPATGPCAAWS